jgi:hypothetical protein
VEKIRVYLPEVKIILPLWENGLKEIGINRISRSFEKPLMNVFVQKKIPITLVIGLLCTIHRGAKATFIRRNTI